MVRAVTEHMSSCSKRGPAFPGLVAAVGALFVPAACGDVDRNPPLGSIESETRVGKVCGADLLTDLDGELGGCQAVPLHLGVLDLEAGQAIDIGADGTFDFSGPTPVLVFDPLGEFRPTIRTLGDDVSVVPVQRRATFEALIADLQAQFPEGMSTVVVNFTQDGAPVIGGRVVEVPEGTLNPVFVDSAEPPGFTPGGETGALGTALVAGVPIRGAESSLFVQDDFMPSPVEVPFDSFGDTTTLIDVVR